MRDPNRIHETMELLEEMWNRFPDWRFMQLINNIQKAYGSDMFYVEDDEFSKLIKEYIVTIEPPKKKKNWRNK